MYPFQPAFTPITPKELSVSDTTFKVLVLSEGIEPSFHPYQRCVLTILLRELFLTTTWLLSSLWNSYHSILVVICGLGEFCHPDPSLNRRMLLLLSYKSKFTPLHRLNGPAAIWEWGFPVISGLRGSPGNRTLSSRFSVLRADHLHKRTK